MQSATPSPPAIGPSSTSSTESSDRRAIREAEEARAGLARLNKLTGIDSNDRNLEIEDEAVRRDIELHQRELFGDSQFEATAAEGDSEDGSEMQKILAARDVYVTQAPQVPTSAPTQDTGGPPAMQPPAQQPQPYNPPAAAPVASTTKPASWLLPALFGAAVPLGGMTGAAATYWAMRQEPRETEYVDESLSMGLGQIEDYVSEK